MITSIHQLTNVQCPVRTQKQKQFWGMMFPIRLDSCHTFQYKHAKLLLFPNFGRSNSWTGTRMNTATDNATSTTPPPPPPAAAAEAAEAEASRTRTRTKTTKSYLHDSTWGPNCQMTSAHQSVVGFCNTLNSSFASPGTPERVGFSFQPVNLGESTLFEKFISAFDH